MKNVTPLRVVLFLFYKNCYLFHIPYSTIQLALRKYKQQNTPSKVEGGLKIAPIIYLLLFFFFLLYRLIFLLL